MSATHTSHAVVRRSYRTSGRLIPRAARRLRGRSLRLRPGAGVPWHSTGAREELLVVVEGIVRLEWSARHGQLKHLRLSAGACAFIAQAVVHRVRNASRRAARYLYLTA